MNIRTFVAASVPEALDCVRGTLGSRATIMRMTASGSGNRRQVEITAASDVMAAERAVSSIPTLDRQAWEIVMPFISGERSARATSVAPSSTADWLEACDFLPEVAQQIRIDGASADASMQRLASRLQVQPSRGSGLLPMTGHSRRIALIGPPGAGKTTALLKLATEAVSARRSDVAIVRLDGCRLGTGSDLMPFGELLQVPILAENNPEVQRGLPEAEGVMLIDTESRLCGSDPGAEAARRVLDALRPDAICLVLSAAWRAIDLQSAWQRFRTCRPTHLLFSGLDLTHRYGGILSVAWLSRLPVAGTLTSGRLDCSTREFRPQALLQQMLHLQRSDEEMNRV